MAKKEKLQQPKLARPAKDKSSPKTVAPPKSESLAKSELPKSAAEQGHGAEKPAETPQPPASAKPSGPVVVGMGASAGGLESFKKFFDAMPSDSGLAFVLIQHLDPTHESMMVELLATHTKMHISQVVKETPIEPNHVYIAPAGKYLAVRNGLLCLSEPAERRGMRMPIDHFFRSLAEDLRERAICIILSGTGTEGTLGLRAVKEQGGMAMVQEPASAPHDSMPRSAISTGLVDFVIPVESMPEILSRYVRHPYIDGAMQHIDGAMQPE